MEIGVRVPRRVNKGENGCVVHWARYVGTGSFSTPGIKDHTVYPEIDPVSPLEKGARGDPSHPLNDVHLTGSLWDV